jgi:hypothetical protein
MEEALQHLQNPWIFLPIGYLFTIAIETPVLCVGLSSQHALSRRLLAGVWLTACTYPLVVIVVPQFFDPTTQRPAYLAVAESIAHFGECVIFYLAFRPLQHFWRDMITVFAANLASFCMGELMWLLLGMYDEIPNEVTSLIYLATAC